MAGRQWTHDNQVSLVKYEWSTVMYLNDTDHAEVVYEEEHRYVVCSDVELDQEATAGKHSSKVDQESTMLDFNKGLKKNNAPKCF